MKYRIIFIGFLIIVLILDACKNKQQIPNREQITEIILETIKQDSLDINIPICINIVNRYIYQQEYNKDLGYLPPPSRNKKGEPFVFKYYKSTDNDSLGFIQTDSIFIVEQIVSNKNISLDLKIVPRDIKIKNISVDNYKEQRLYKFLLPLFNKNHDFALVEYDFQCTSCGYGILVFLKKINGKWIKIKSFGTWTS